MSDFVLKVMSVERKTNYAVARSDMEDGTNERRLLHEAQVDSWTLTSPALTTAQAQAYLNFFSSKYGSLTSFTWTCPLDGVEYTVNFVDGTFKLSKDKGVIQASWEFERNLNA